MSAGMTAQGTHVRQVAVAPVTPLAVLRALGSLKITVALFVFAILIVLVGTLAQDEQTLIEVKREYFNSWIAWIPFDVFVPQTIYPHAAEYGGGIPFPGGATVGLGLLINLLAAKSTRFAVQAKSSRLVWGALISTAGGLLVLAVIMTGHSTEGLQGKPPISYDQMWSALKIGLLLVALALAGYVVRAKSLPSLARWTLAAGAGLLGALAVTLLVSDLRLDDPGLRIVWQLFQATLASLVVLVGFLMLFGKRGGNMLIHVGLALLMIGQFFFGDRQVEQKVYLSEGEQSNVTFIPDQLEIAFIDSSDAGEDRVAVIPDARIRQALRSNETIDDPALPCLVHIDKWMINSALGRLESGEENPATAGLGLTIVAHETAPSGGAKSAINLASTYLTLLDRQTKQPISTVLLAQQINDGAQMFRGGKDRYETLEIGGKSFELALRFRKEYKPYEITLDDVRKLDYANSDTPRDYSSIIHIRNPETGEEITEKTWMNNPVRFGGETFYQSDYFSPSMPGGVEGSGLQVVKNAGWVIPYVCCMMVMVGMFSHFGNTFVRFANRIAREEAKTQPIWTGSVWKYLAAGAALGMLVGAYGLKGNSYHVLDADWKTIERLPVLQDGRIKPADTVAINTLQQLSEPVFGGLPYVKDGDGKKRSRVEWLLAVMADVPWTRDVPVFRIYAKEVRDILSLEDNSNFRYSYNQINEHREAFFAEVDKLREKSRNQEELNFREQKVSEMYSKLTAYDLLSAAYEEPPLPRLDSEDNNEIQSALMKLDQLSRRYGTINQMHPAAFIPPLSKSSESGDDVQGEWQAYAPARFNSILARVRGEPVNPAVDAFDELMKSVREQDGKAINTAARKFRLAIADSPVGDEYRGRINAEVGLNSFNPTSLGIMLYMGSFILGVVALGSKRLHNLRDAATGLLVSVFVIHTITLLLRIYISGKAPVVNLYSSAVFIGWACVLFFLILEFVFRSRAAGTGGLSIANLVGSLIGLITLAIARSLDKSDTLHVLMAVLDTQFWLSTHVVAITLGYAVTYAAGFLGMGGLAYMMFDRDRSPGLEQRDPYREIYRMAYFAVCFGILFSFVGTVLGGLWADDSWGRFWGWDPKENGALMIVLWNALVLHARWDRLVGMRGFFILAVVGNVVTSWSWFGTNLLGIGLHNYGFNKSIAWALLATLVVHVSFITAALTLTSSKFKVEAERR